MAVLSDDGKKILGLYCAYTGVYFNATIYDNLPVGASIDNAVWFRNPPTIKNSKGETVPLGGYALRDFIGNVLLDWYGPKCDGVTNDSPVFQKAAARAALMGKELDLSAKDGAYFLASDINVLCNINGHDAKIISKNRPAKLFTVLKDNVTVLACNASFIQDEQATIAPIFVYSKGFNNVKVLFNNIYNGRVSLTNQDALNAFYNYNITGNLFDADFSKFDNYDIQNDLLYFNGCRELIIKDNVIRAKNANRIIKASAATTGGAFGESSKGFIIDDNFITSETNSTKQVMDLYAFTCNGSISGNHIKARGHYSVIENKTTQLRTENTNLNIFKNIVDTDGTFFRAFGTFGSTEGNESAYQNVKLIGNDVVTRGLARAIDIAHYHFVNISGGNTFRRDSINSALATQVNIAGTDRLIVDANDFFGGNLALNHVPQVDQALYNKNFGSAKITGNKFHVFGSVTYNAIEIKDLENCDFIYADHNIIYGSPLSGNRALHLTNVNCTHFTATNNKYIGTAGGGISIITSNIANRVLRNNSWVDAATFEPIYSYTNIQDSMFLSAGSPAPYTLPVNNVNEIVECFPNTSNSILRVINDSSWSDRVSKKIKNSGSKVLTVSNASGLGNMLVYPGESLELMTLQGTFRLVSTSTVAWAGYGGTANRPTSPRPGYLYTDSTLEKVLVYTGSAYIDAVRSATTTIRGVMFKAAALAASPPPSSGATVDQVAAYLLDLVAKMRAADQLS